MVGSETVQVSPGGKGPAVCQQQDDAGLCLLLELFNCSQQRLEKLRDKTVMPGRPVQGEDRIRALRA